MKTGIPLPLGGQRDFATGTRVQIMPPGLTDAPLSGFATFATAHTIHLDDPLKTQDGSLDATVQEVELREMGEQDVWQDSFDVSAEESGADYKTARKNDREIEAAAIAISREEEDAFRKNKSSNGDGERNDGEDNDEWQNEGLLLRLRRALFSGRQ